MSKTRSDSVLDGLPANQREALEGWLFEENASLDKALERLRLDFGVRSSRSALQRWYQRRAQARLLERIAANAGRAREIEAEFARDAAGTAAVPGAVVKLVTQLAFEHLAGGAKDLDPHFIVKLTKLAVDSGLKAKKLELDERRIAMLEQKAKQAGEAEAALKDSALTPEERERRMRQIFGLS